MIEFALAVIAAASAGDLIGDPAGDRLSFAGPASAVIERVVDGDTIKMRIAIWIDQEVRVSVRLAGVDAPELFRPKCAAEKARARAAKVFVEDFLKGGDAALLDIARGKYAGRVVARVEANGRDLGTALVAAGYAVASDKGDWCAGA